jgi:hypothetical protein
LGAAERNPTTCSPSSPWRWSAANWTSAPLRTVPGQRRRHRLPGHERRQADAHAAPAICANWIWRIPRNFIIDDTASLTVDYVKRRVWALKRRGPVGAVFIDYLQIMERPGPIGRNDAAVIGEMTNPAEDPGPGPPVSASSC